MKILILLLFLTGCSVHHKGKVISNWDRNAYGTQRYFSVVISKKGLYKVNVGGKYPKVGQIICFKCRIGFCERSLCQ